MTESIEQFEKIKTSVEQLRDEIKLKAHLGNAEAKEDWKNLKGNGTPSLPSISPWSMKRVRLPPKKAQPLPWLVRN